MREAVEVVDEGRACDGQYGRLDNPDRSRIMPVSPCCFIARGVNAQKFPDNAIDHDPNPHSQVTDDTRDIANRAYELFLAAGAPHGRDLEHWLQAERELRTRSVSAGN
jgi:hypothetical protein